MPSGNIDKPTIEDNHDGTVSLKYEPREEGLHEISVKFNGEHVQGKLTLFEIESVSKKKKKIENIIKDFLKSYFLVAP